MPFQSEQQRKYLWANEPAIAKRWEKYPKGYNTGGVSHLFRSKEDRVGFNAGSWRGNPGTDSRKEVRDAWKAFLEYRKNRGTKTWQQYMPIWIGANLAHGGYVRPEDSGVLGLAEGGKIIEGQPHNLAYITPGEAKTLQNLGGKKVMTKEGIPAYPEWDVGQGTTKESYEAGRTGDHRTRDDSNQQDHRPTMRDVAGPVVQPTKKDPITDDKGDDAREKYISEQYTSPEALEAKKRRELRNLVNRQEEEKEDYVAPPKKKSLLGALATAIAWYTGLAPLLGLKVPAVVQTLGTGFKMKSQLEYGLKKYNKQFGTNYNLDEFIAKTTDRLKKEHAERQEKMALYKSLPDGHPEKIALSIELEIGKKPEHLGDGDGDGDNIDITYENIEETNDLKEKVRASKETMDFLYAPEKEDRSKQMAYWQSLMAPYMSAQGGRVPQGYNTGGLSNLFRLKNR